MNYNSLSSKQLPVGIVGLSHLGIVWCAAFARLGIKIIGFDKDKKVVKDLNDNIVTIPEPGIQKIFTKYKSQLTFSTKANDLNKCDIVIFAKDMPYDEDGIIQPARINRLLKIVLPALKKSTEFVFMCQVPVGYTRRLRRKIEKKYCRNKINLTYLLQTITIGTSLEWFDNPDKIVFGIKDNNSKPNKIVINLFSLFNCPIQFASYESAELTKAAISLSLACSVSFVNTISDLCEKLGANINEIVTVMKLDQRFSKYNYWRPGLGFAGGHIERDLNTLLNLSKKNKIQPTLLISIMQGSRERFQWLTNIVDNLIIMKNKKPRICVWGLAYKKGTDSTHNAHCLKVFKYYSKIAEITAYDPLALVPHKFTKVIQFKDKQKALKNADCLVVLTEWDEFAVKEPSLFRTMRNKIIVDCVNIIREEVRKSRLIKYFGMGVTNIK